MEHDAQLVETERLDRLVERDLPARDRESRGGHRVGDVARRHGAVKLAALAGLADDGDGDAVERLGHFLGFALALEIGGFELRPPGLEIGQIVLGRAQRLFLRQQEIAGEAGLHLHDLPHLTELLDALEEDDFDRHGLLLAQAVGQEAEEARALDRLRQFALLLGGYRGDAARHDLAALRDKALQQLHVLVVDLGRVRAGERAGFAPAEERPPRRRTAAATALATIAATVTTALAAVTAAAAAARAARNSVV